MSEKPVIFISHDSFDRSLAITIKEQIEATIGSEVAEVFVSSDVRAIAPGVAWFDAINEKLDLAKILIVLVTPESGKSTWVGYEIGYFWKRKNSDETLSIYPLLLPGTPIFGPLMSLQAKILDDYEAVEFWFHTLNDQLGSRKMPTANIDRIIHQTNQLIQLYRKLEVNNSNLPEEWTEKDIEELFRKRFESYLGKEFWLSPPPLTGMDRLRNLFDRDHAKTIFKGKFISFKQLDEELDLPKGTSRKLLKLIAQEYSLIPHEEDDYGIRFSFVPRQ